MAGWIGLALVVIGAAGLGRCAIFAAMSSDGWKELMTGWKDMAEIWEKDAGHWKGLALGGLSPTRPLNESVQHPAQQISAAGVGGIMSAIGTPGSKFYYEQAEPRPKTRTK